MSDKKWNSWVWVKWKPGAPAEVWKQWKSNTKIANGWSTLGDWDCVFSLKSDDPNEVEKFVWNELKSNEWVEDTQTTFAKQWW